MDLLCSTYVRECKTNSDINEHLPTLMRYAMACQSVIELGVRGCVSSWALLYGLVVQGTQKKRFTMNDIIPCDVNSILQCIQKLNTEEGYCIEVNTEWCNDLDIEIDASKDKYYELVFIDTWHVYGQLKRELEHYATSKTKYIIMHDTEVDGERGECMRYNAGNYPEILRLSESSGFSIEEICKGLKYAINEFLETHPEWVKEMEYTNNNGLTVLKNTRVM